MKTIIISVTNDLVADYRVHRAALTLHQKLGFNVILVGRKLKSSPPVQTQPYRIIRFKLPIEKGPLFYALYNITLFIYILFHKVDILLSNDLDTLPANYLISKIRGKKLVFDSHELFTALPELIHRPKTRAIWEIIERWTIPSIHAGYTVCQSIANVYSNKYDKSFVVVRNVPPLKEIKTKSNSIEQPFGNKKVIIYQGSVNVGRGLEKMIVAMSYIETAVFWILGEGDITGQLKKLVQELKLQNRIKFIGRIPFAEVHSYTEVAHLGISLEENRGLNYYYALPNKLFGYIQAGIPVLVSDFPEMAGIVKKYNVGEVTLEDNPEKLADLIKAMLSDEEKRSAWKVNLKKAAEELCWEIEEEKLISVFRPLLTRGQ